MKPEVSIILPSYNYENYIGKAIDSVINQSYPNWELIIIDDGSTDNSINVIKRYRDKRIHLFTQKNIGVSKTLNRGIQLSKGKYICFLDADDKYHPEKLSYQVEYMDSGFDIVTTEVQAIDDKDEKSSFEHFNVTWNSYDKDKIFGKDKLSNFLYKNYFCKSSLMIKKNLFDKYGLFDPRLITAYDLELWLKIIPNAQITRIDKVLTYYRWHNKNETTINNNRIRTELLLILDNFIKNIDTSIDDKLLKKYLESINNCIKENNLYKGFIALQLIKNVYKLEDNYDLLKIKNAQDIIYNSINNILTNNNNINVESQQENVIPENQFQHIRRKLIPFKVRKAIRGALIKIKSPK